MNTDNPVTATLTIEVPVWWNTLEPDFLAHVIRCVEAHAKGLLAPPFANCVLEGNPNEGFKQVWR